MQFTVNTTTLVDALGWVAKSLPVRPSVPILAGVKLSVENGVLTLSAFDYEQSAIATVDVDAATDGTVVVSGRLLADIVRALPKGDMKVTLDGTKCLVQAKSSKFTLQVMPVGDYPTLPENPTPLGSVDANQFADAIRTVVPAAGKDDMLPVLTAVNVHIDPAAGVLTLAATDRFRLAVRKVPFQGAPDGEAVSALVPARILDQWAKALTGEEGSRFTFGTGGDAASVFAVEADRRSATVRLIDGQYPKYEALIPADFSAESVVNGLDLIAAVKRVALVAERGDPASLVFNSDGIVVSVAADSTATEEVDAQHAGSEVTIGFNVAYLLDGLNAIGAREARISLVAGNKPAVLRPIEGEDTYTYLLMPMRGGGS
jgi:DNA polymerase-3 subunit beta